LVGPFDNEIEQLFALDRLEVETWTKTFKRYVS